MTKIGIVVLSVCVTCLIISCVTVEWDWKADPYWPDIISQDMINADTPPIVCAFSDECMHDKICFPVKNIEELEYNIEKLDIPKTERSKLKKYFNKVFKGNPDV